MSGEGSSQVHTKTVVLQYAERCRLLECGGVVADCDSPDRRRKPATVASRCGNPVRHQPVSDRLKCPSVGTLRKDPLGDLQRKGWRCSQSLTTGALGRQGISGALTDQPALVLGTRNDDVRCHLASRRASVDVEVGEVQRPALASGSLHQTRTVHNRATQPVHLGHQQSTCLAATHRLQGCKCGGATFQGFRTRHWPQGPSILTSFCCSRRQGCGGARWPHCGSVMSTLGVAASALSGRRRR